MKLDSTNDNRQNIICKENLTFGQFEELYKRKWQMVGLCLASLFRNT